MLNVRFVHDPSGLLRFWYLPWRQGLTAYAPGQQELKTATFLQSYGHFGPVERVPDHRQRRALAAIFFSTFMSAMICLR